MSTSRSQTEQARSGLDTLSSVCYTIPWRPKKKSKRTPSTSGETSKDPSPSPFPVLAEFEADSDPARVRYASYQIAIQKTEALFERCMDDVYSSLFHDLRSFLKAQQGSTHPEGSTLAQVGLAEENLFLPGFESTDTAQAGPSSTDGSARSIPTALLISTSAPYLSSFSNRLVSAISNANTDGPPSIVVTLSASECSNLYTALRLLVARFIAQGSSLGSTGEADLSDVEAAAFAGKVEPDLHVLRSWWQHKFGLSGGPKLVFNLPTIEAVEPTVLSDLLSALQTFVADPSARSSPQLLLVLGITSPSAGLSTVPTSSTSTLASSAPAPWIDYIPRSVLRVLDISRFSLPSKELVWSSLVQTFLLSRHLPLSLGPSTFEYIRETYWEREADLDALLDAVRLAFFIHFTGKPESVFTIPGQAARVRFYSWTPKFVERVKMAFLTTNADGQLVLPLLADASRTQLDVAHFLEEASQSDQFILSQLDSLRHPRELLCFRLELAVRFLSRAFDALMRIQSRATTAAQALHSRHTPTGAQAVEVDEQRLAERSAELLTQVVLQCLNSSVGSVEGRKVPPVLTLRSGLARLCNAARRLLSDEFETWVDELVVAAEEEVRRIEEALPEETEEVEDQLRSVGASIGAQSAGFLAGLRTFQQRLSQTITAGDTGMDDDMTTTAADASAKREARLQRVQRKLVMEEKLLGLKREITDWLQSAIHDLSDWSSSAQPLALLKDVFWVDCYSPLSTLLDPSTRAGLTLPLAEPREFIESLHDAALSVVPQDEVGGIEVGEVGIMSEPDVCRVFGLYLECGKFVNLGDWYEAFKQSVEADREEEEDEVEPMTPSKRRTRVDLDEESDETDVLDTPSKKRPRTAQLPKGSAGGQGEGKVPESDLQSRFALALNEIARMGMVRGTRRRQEHITKVMWDLVPDSF
ncbi:Origin recognition complex, subunit 3 [Kalmanozyma brasiliensis GHG001]|uniref:Uncharacterized protein n=1 Tax=Kalmanozyma brasiliensis (strain GHG001) TaxID=1365824 RepID=V5GKT7_KALBG|nr:Origin recognition complex, subunit 3 [Kalmanozyma brasiliensis GHG001]EST06557.1 Origin recognition complex, subunit 3 [Kalmanozyma brasiliensis GHG001]